MIFRVFIERVSDNLYALRLKVQSYSTGDLWGNVEAYAALLKPVTWTRVSHSIKCTLIDKLWRVKLLYPNEKV